MVGVSPLQKAQRAFVTVLLRLAAKYCLQLGVTRDSSAKELTAAFRKVARRTHPDKGGTTADTQALNAAREAWVAQTSLLRRPGPKTVAPTCCSQQAAACGCTLGQAGAFAGMQHPISH